jgi:hypothetical protein
MAELDAERRPDVERDSFALMRAPKLGAEERVLGRAELKLTLDH